MTDIVNYQFESSQYNQALQALDQQKEYYKQLKEEGITSIAESSPLIVDAYKNTKEIFKLGKTALNKAKELKLKGEQAVKQGKEAFEDIKGRATQFTDISKEELDKLKTKFGSKWESAVKDINAKKEQFAGDLTKQLEAKKTEQMTKYNDLKEKLGREPNKEEITQLDKEFREYKQGLSKNFDEYRSNLEKGLKESFVKEPEALAGEAEPSGAGILESVKQFGGEVINKAKSKIVGALKQHFTMDETSAKTKASSMREAEEMRDPEDLNSRFENVSSRNRLIDSVMESKNKMAEKAEQTLGEAKQTLEQTGKEASERATTALKAGEQGLADVTKTLASTEGKEASTGFFKTLAEKGVGTLAKEAFEKVGGEALTATLGTVAEAIPIAGEIVGTGLLLESAIKDIFSAEHRPAPVASARPVFTPGI